MASGYKVQDLRIVLLGVSGAGKSPIANAILGRDAFKESRTRESEIQRGKVEDRNVSIIDTPGFFNNQLTDEDLQNQMMKSLSLAHPGPHIFLLVTNLETFREDERNIVEKIQEIFGAQALNLTMVLFTGRQLMPNREWMELKFSRKFQNIISHCRGQYHVINSKSEINQTHITKLLEKIDKIIEQNTEQYYVNKTYLKSTIKIRNEKKKQQEENEKDRKKEQGEQIKQEQKKIVCETIKMHSVKDKNTRNVTENKSFISNVTKSERNYLNEDRFKVQQENKNDEEELVKQSVKSLRNSFENMGEKNTVQKPDKCWKTSGIGQWDQKKQQTETEQHQTQAVSESIQNRHTKSGNCRDLRILMVGKTGTGKSATGNTILRQKTFKEELSTESVTKKCQQHQHTVDGRNISVIDTPGLFDTAISEEQLKKEIEKCVEMSVPGPHVFLLVIRLDVRFTDEEKNTVKWIQENFGEEAARYTIILFTRGDQLDKPIEEFLKTDEQFKELIRPSKAGYHVFNNKDENRSQATELIGKIDRMVMENGGEHYTNEMYKEAQRKIWEEGKSWREEEERKKVEEEEKIREDERTRLLSMAKDAALVGTGVVMGVGAAVAGGAVVASTGGATLCAAVISGAAGAGNAVLASNTGRMTLPDALMTGAAVAGNVALKSFTGGASLTEALITGGAAAMSRIQVTVKDPKKLKENAANNT